MTDSQSHNNVIISSYDTNERPSLRRNSPFSIPISRSHQPPHHGADGGLNLQSIFFAELIQHPNLTCWRQSQNQRNLYHYHCTLFVGVLACYKSVWTLAGNCLLTGRISTQSALLGKRRMWIGISTLSWLTSCRRLWYKVDPLGPRPSLRIFLHHEHGFLEVVSGLLLSSKKCHPTTSGRVQRTPPSLAPLGIQRALFESERKKGVVRHREEAPSPAPGWRCTTPKCPFFS